MNASIDGLSKVASPNIMACAPGKHVHSTLTARFDATWNSCIHLSDLLVNGSLSANALAEQARMLLDFTQKLDINLLDTVVNCMYTGEGGQQRVAQEVLTTLKEHPEAWTRVDTILEFSKNQQTKYYALQILETVIKTRWKVLPRNQCEGIKNFIVGLIIKTSSDPVTMDKEKVYLNKLNMILVQILKRDWPKKWPTFIGDIVGSSRTNESLCQNNMIILKLLR